MTPVWVVAFGPYNGRRHLSRMVIVPPSAASVATELIVFNESHKLGASPTGVSTGFAPVRTIPIAAGTVIYVVWYVSGGNAPEVTLHMDQDAWL
ncbi:hypothetical protein ACFWY9_30615 [Amycolatopsis sp. NPDC059027]|uniref:hypothetical protein n=1 Tax=Amycolatopsis sp. NPDC059027 TaxID=3346709 RepID=UPI00366FEBB8